MTLLELAEPLFQYMCRLNRSARKGGSVELAQVRSDIKHIFEDMRSRASQEPGMIEQYEKAELPLTFFVDFMIKESTLSFRSEWKELAYEKNELAGDEKFWDLLEETLADESPSATERLPIFYTCIGLGFTGWYAGQPEYLRQKMMTISARIRRLLDADETKPICPDAYENVDTSDLVEPPGRSLVGIVIALIGLVTVLFFGNIYLYYSNTAELVDALKAIIETHETADTPSARLPIELDREVDRRAELVVVATNREGAA